MKDIYKRIVSRDIVKIKKKFYRVIRTTKYSKMTMKKEENKYKKETINTNLNLLFLFV